MGQDASMTETLREDRITECSLDDTHFQKKLEELCRDGKLMKIVSANQPPQPLKNPRL